MTAVPTTSNYLMYAGLQMAAEAFLKDDTLFRCTADDPATGAKVGDLVMSFRSTEFIDDAARDNQATRSRGPLPAFAA